MGTMTGALISQIGIPIQTKWPNFFMKSMNNHTHTHTYIHSLEYYNLGPMGLTEPTCQADDDTLQYSRTAGADYADTPG